MSPNSMGNDDPSCGDRKHETMEGLFHSCQDEVPSSLV